MKKLKPIELAIAPQAEFHDAGYIRHNARRLEHLASLGLDLHNKTVLEVGAGIGDHTTFYLDRGCSVLATDARIENLEVLAKTFAGVTAVQTCLLDLDEVNLDPVAERPHVQVVHCYGTLYHLTRPARAIEYMAKCCTELMVLETCVSLGDEPTLNYVKEGRSQPSQSFHGMGCRPVRRWVWEELARHFEFVYTTVTQPNHSDFPIDWTVDNGLSLKRAVFVASRYRLEGPLCQVLPLNQERAP